MVERTSCLLEFKEFLTTNRFVGRLFFLQTLIALLFTTTRMRLTKAGRCISQWSIIQSCINILNAHLQRTLNNYRQLCKNQKNKFGKSCAVFFQSSSENLKPKLSQLSIRTKISIIFNRRELDLKTGNLLKARENAGNQVIRDYPWHSVERPSEQNK